jgi:hypothetical protein
VLRQLPDDGEYMRQYSILLNPLKQDATAVTDELKEVWHIQGASGGGANRPDNLLLQTWDKQGSYDPK